MNEIVVIFCVFFLTLIGTLLIKGFRLFPRVSIFEVGCYGYGLGVGCIAFQLFLYSRLGIDWNQVTLLLPWMLLALYLFFFKKNIFKIKEKFFSDFNLKNTALFILIIVTITFVGFEAMIRPVSAWDGWSSWLLKSKIFFIDQKIDPSIFTYLNDDYPLTVSTMGTFFYEMLGTIDDRVVLFLFFAFFVAMGGVFFFSSRKFLGTGRALLFTFLLLSIQNLIRHGGRFEAGQADLVLGYYFLASFLLFIHYMYKKDSKILIILNIFLAIAALVKNEGLPFSIFVQCMLVYYLFKQRKLKHILFSLFWLLPIFDWQIYKYTNDIPKIPVYLGGTIQFERLPLVLWEMLQEFFNIKNWNLSWIVFLASFCLYLTQKKSFYPTILFLAVLFQLSLYIGVFLITKVDPMSHIHNVIDRLLLHIAPMAVFVAAYVLFKNKDFV